jgi:hypothetical protein
MNENIKAKGKPENQAVPNENQPNGRIKMIIQPAKKSAETNNNEDT